MCPIPLHQPTFNITNPGFKNANPCLLSCFTNLIYYLLLYYLQVFFFYFGYLIAFKFQERERRAKAMKLTLVNFIIATVIITTMVKAGPLKEVFQISPASDPIQLSGADRQSKPVFLIKNGECKPTGDICHTNKECCFPACAPRSHLYSTMFCQ